MHIRSIHVRHFRSIEKSSLPNCGCFNVLIGRNNAGKSNLLSTVDFIVAHLNAGTIARPLWRAQRPLDLFTDRVASRPFQIAVEIDLPEDINQGLRELLTAEGPHLERSIEQIMGREVLTFVLTGRLRRPSQPFVYLEQVCLGTVVSDSDPIATDGISLLRVNEPAAMELHDMLVEVTTRQTDVRSLERVLTSPQVRYTFQNPESGRYLADSAFANVDISAEGRREAQAALRVASSFEELTRLINELVAKYQDDIAKTEKRPTNSAFQAFAGETRTTPGYIPWLLKELRANTLHLRENKAPIGREEAEQLLRLKVKRGGPERLRLIQDTVNSLLGVSVDAFEGEGSKGNEREASAEMDIDDFLVQANGAGVREALRMILDIELKSPALALIEEPEVHLHPGMARAVDQYLRQKSVTVQIFVATHSTEFVDAAGFQNVYIVSRHGSNKTSCVLADADQAVFKLRCELGLRLSSVFMFDRLIFVEGPSDEAVLRELASHLDLDAASVNVGFVQLGGVRNFAHYAARATLELLTRRQVDMWFVVDRDEAEADEIRQMLERLGGRAHLAVLSRREIENFLMAPAAVTAYLGCGGVRVGEDDVTRVINEEANKLRDEVFRLRVERKTLRPVFLQTRQNEGSIQARIEAAIGDLNARLNHLEEVEAQVAADLDRDWAVNMLALVPGSCLLQRVAHRLGGKFSKQDGDSVRLARVMRPQDIAHELRTLLQTVTAEAR